MPFLAKIFEEGTRAKLRSTPNPLTPPAWVSLMTGRGPGHHGVFDFIRAEERGDDVFFTLYDSRDCRVETIWSIASRQGQKVAALNFPVHRAAAEGPERLHGARLRPVAAPAPQLDAAGPVRPAQDDPRLQRQGARLGLRAGEAGDGRADRRGPRELGALPPAARAAVVPHRRPPAARGSAGADGGDVRRRRQAAAPGLAVRRPEASRRAS